MADPNQELRGLSMENRRNSMFVGRIRFSHLPEGQGSNRVLPSLCSEDPIVKWNCLPIANLTARKNCCQ
jgi:hypothetical protein